MTGFWKKIDERLGVPLAILLTGFAAGLFLHHYAGALDAWFMREDSRFFSVGLFSFYDLWNVFTTPVNSMGQYRPITKLLWGLPQWLFGTFDPRHFHAVSLALLGLTGISLARLHFHLFRSVPYAVLAGVLFVLMPVNAKPMYWISAWHNTAAALFSLAALTFRYEQWRSPRRKTLYRALCLLALFLALASREVAFGVAVLLFVIDYGEGKLRRSGDVALLLGAMFYFVFLFDPPFDRASVKPDFARIFAPHELASMLWEYARSTFWTYGDHIQSSYALVPTVLSACGLGLIALGPFVHRTLFLPALLAAAGIAPFLLLKNVTVEYPALFAAGVALLFTGFLSRVEEKAGARANVPACLIAAGLAFAYHQYMQPSRQFYVGTYVGRSVMLRNFVEELRAYGEKQAPFRRIHIVDFGPYQKSEAQESHHFLYPGLHEVIPTRVFLFSREALGINDGTGSSNPAHGLWLRTYQHLDPAVEARYTERGFAP